ncbi:hypothetical protein CBER1_11065 [Cercospora berteroae]|uniref:2EXR domain-containing protein n=1 Tax=Cercospora berteroae TaxID=357750 RepID=A0A2S6BYL6_9PEZI|nr:hypothetical protein CBER1_11065 [Cercospora berteroae]
MPLSQPDVTESEQLASAAASLVIHDEEDRMGNDPTIPPTNGRCCFSELSAELRNEIYRMSLVHDCPIMLEVKQKETRTRARQKYECYTAPPPEPALLSTSRQARKEALAIYYGENDFEIPVGLANYATQNCGLIESLRSFEKHLGDRARLIEISFEDWNTIGQLNQYGSVVFDPIQHWCACDLKKLVDKHKRKGRSGEVIFSVMRRFCTKYMMGPSESFCSKCGLEVMVQLQD